MSDKVVVIEDLTAGYFVSKGLSLTKRFVPVITDVDLEIRRGERLAIIGESGAGKTTLVKVILGLLKPRRGKVVVLGIDMYHAKKNARKKVLRRIGYVPQDPSRSLNPKMKIQSILAEPLEESGYTRKIVEEKIKRALRYVHLHESVLDYYPDQLSGGMMQRVLIARALVHEPEIIILDEPTSALDVSIQAQIINILETIYDSLRPTMITITHDIPVAQYLADRAIIVYRGRIVERGDMDEIINKPKHPYTKTLIESYRLELI